MRADKPGPARPMSWQAAALLIAAASLAAWVIILLVMRWLLR